MDGAALQISGDSPELRAVARSTEDPSPASPLTRLEYAFQQCGDPLYRFIALRVGDCHAAEDLLQQTCYEAARKRRIPIDQDAAQAWLFGIARNLIRKYFRRLRRENRIGIQAAESPTTAVALPDAPVPSPTGGDFGPHLFPAMATLSHADQQLLLGTYFEGRSQQQLAAELGVSVRAIEGRLYRARQSLREALQRFAEGQTQ